MFRVATSIEPLLFPLVCGGLLYANIASIPFSTKPVAPLNDNSGLKLLIPATTVPVLSKADIDNLLADCANHALYASTDHATCGKSLITNFSE